MELPDNLVKKRIVFRHSRVTSYFDVSQSLFSSFEIDVGTKTLLNSLRKNKSIDYQRILDLGCGYGPIGIFLKKQDSSRVVEMVDRDLLAIAFSKHNAALNGTDLHIYPGLDFDSTVNKFSLICCNFPAKLEEIGLNIFLTGASEHLIPNGILATVVVKELHQSLMALINNWDIEIIFKEERKAYSIFHLSFPREIPYPIFGYERSSIDFVLSNHYHLTTARGLGEFDTASHSTEALVELIKRINQPVKSVLVFEPGQGLGAVAAADILQPETILLSGRDLLSLKFAMANLKGAFSGDIECRPVPYMLEPPSANLVIWQIKDRDSLALHAHNLHVLQRSPVSIAACGEKHLLERLIKADSTTLHNSIEYKGHFAALLP